MNISWYESTGLSAQLDCVESRRSGTRPVALLHGQLKALLRVTSCPPDVNLLRQKKCALARRAVGLAPADGDKLEAELADFVSAVTPLDDQVFNLRGPRTAENETKRAQVIAQRQQLLKDKVAALRQKLSPEGAQQLDAYIASMKRKIKFIPTAMAK